MSQPMWIVKIIKKWFSLVYPLAGATKKPVIGPLLDKAFFKSDDMVWLPRDKVISVRRPLDDPGSVVLPSQIVDHFIEKSNYLWIMKNCICRESTHCKDYATDLGCLFLGRAAMDINPKLGMPATKQEALDHIARCRDAGLIQLIGRIKLDELWLNVKPGDRLLSICNCCPCCCLWGKISLIAPNIGDHISKMPGAAVYVSDECSGCGRCADGVCFMNAITLRGERAEINADLCRGCGRCVTACQSDAIELRIEDDAYVQKVIEKITPLVDVT